MKKIIFTEEKENFLKLTERKMHFLSSHSPLLIKLWVYILKREK
jgi:hypothetical protein